MIEEKYIRETWYAKGNAVFCKMHDEVCGDCRTGCSGREIKIAEVKTESEDAPLIAEIIAQGPTMRRLLDELPRLGAGMEALIRLKRIQAQANLISLKIAEAKKEIGKQ